MRSTVRLFKALPIASNRKKNPSKELLEKTIKKGFIFAPEIVYNYSEKDFDSLIKLVEREIGLTGEKMNNSFHKSWKKVKDAKIEQLVLEQILHYITTYGFEAMEIYNENSVYVPKEKLEVPNLEDNIPLTVIKGYTKEELKEKLLNFLSSGIALAEDTKNDVLDVATYVELNEEEIENGKNKEVKIALYDYLNKFPENPTEFLRYLVFKSTEKTLLIKNKETIKIIKSKKNLNIQGLLVRYKNKHGLERLSEIFNRFKPIFLAFKTTNKLNTIINKISKLSKTNHKPMKEDYLNEVTAKVANGKLVQSNLKTALTKANTFRKIRLAYALKFRSQNVESIMYKVRNGKSYAKEYKFAKQNEAKKALDIVLDSITKDISKNVKGKKFYIPNNITYALPATEKQFTGYFPSGTYITTPKDMVVGVHWNNVDNHRIDLDLSLVSANNKIGWDADYRNDNKTILFSGDLTNAPSPNGASELFYVKTQVMSSNIMIVNYYNFMTNVEVPFKIMVGQDSPKNMNKSYMLDPNKVISVAKSSINTKQKILGLLVTTTKENRFYFAETNLGVNISSDYSDENVQHTRKFLFDFYTNTINLNKVLEKAGAKFVEDIEDADIDLSPENLEKDTIISILQ